MSEADPSNPISEADPNSFEKLFSSDPAQLTDGEIDQIVDHLRKARAKWEEGQVKRAPKGPTATEKRSVKNISLDELTGL